MSPAIVDQELELQACALTAEKRGAVAVVRLWGSGSLEIADSVFRPHKSPALSKSPPGTLRLGRIGSGLGDEVVAAVLPIESKKGGIDVAAIEFQCHGGTAAVRLVMNTLETAGVKIRVSGGPFAYSARSLLSAEAWNDVQHAPTSRTAEILLDQATGALELELNRLIAYLERATTDDLSKANEVLEGLILRSRIGLKLLKGWNIVFAGRPNVGKSSLMNCLAGFSRTIVDATPGTTRDVVTHQSSINGLPVHLSDTAGIHDSSSFVERMGIDRAMQAYREADLLIPVLDLSSKLEQVDLEFVARYSSYKSPIVANKSDLPTKWELSDLSISLDQVVAVSALRGASIEELLAKIGSWLLPEPLPPGAGVPFRQVHVAALEQARDLLSLRDTKGAAERLRQLLTRDKLVAGSGERFHGDITEQARRSGQIC